MNPQQTIQHLYEWIGVPVMGLVVVLALAAARLKVVGVALLLLVVSAAFVYSSSGQLQALGHTAWTDLTHLLGL